MKYLISINDAAELGIDRLRMPVWAMAEDHIKIDIFENRPGPWVRLFSPANKWCNKRDPVKMVIMKFDLNEKVFLKYEGSLPESHDYVEKVKSFEK